MEKDKAFGIVMGAMIVLLILWSVWMWNFHPEQVFDKFNDKKYVCDEPCPAKLIECKYEDGTKSWGYCVNWHKKGEMS